jgi:predicted HTH transcriptional regulator
MINKVIRTICAMANTGPNKVGKILIGVTDKDTDAEKVRQLDRIEPKKIGKRFVVGVRREADVLKISLEQYFSMWKDGIRNSELSIHLRDSVLSNVDFHDFYGLGVITFTVPPQTEMSYVGEDTYWRNADSTEKAETAKQIASIAKRF